MRVFVYEFMTATGTGRTPGAPDHGCHIEGRAMRDALAADFRAAGHDVETSAEGEPFADDEPVLRAAARRCDVALVIAPETGGCLWDRARVVLAEGARVLGPGPDAIRLTSDKAALARHWTDTGVRTPRTAPFGTPWDTYPAVLKPRDGAGSQFTYLIRSADEARAALSECRPAGFDGDRLIWQEFVPGRAASVAFLCGPRGAVPLVPAFQHLTADGRFRYEGGELPIPTDLAARAVALGRAAVGRVPGLLGYVGVDVVLGDAADGSADCAIEINPRLTTSYTGLRALAEVNLAALMLEVALGGRWAAPTWKPGRVRFTASGTAALVPAEPPV